MIENRKAKFRYEILEPFEAGLVLRGTEVKSLRAGNANLQDSFGRVEKGEVWLYNMHIASYEQGNRWNVDPTRKRKLLLHHQEIERLIGKMTKRGLALVPLKVYFTHGVAKVEMALARGKKFHDKRESIKRRDVERRLRRSAEDV